MVTEDHSPVIKLSEDNLSDLATRYSARKYREEIYKLLDSGHKNVYVDFENIVSATHSFIDELIAVNLTFKIDKRSMFFESVKFINVNECISVSIHESILIRKMSLTNHFKNSAYGKLTNKGNYNGK
jgi:hypothetical protein